MKTLRALFMPRGGIHPVYHKEVSAVRPIETMPLPRLFLVSLSQHLGAPSKPLVKKGDAVLRGQPIAEPAGYVSAWVHAPTSGVVKSVDSRLTANGQLGMVVAIEADGLDKAVEAPPPHDDWPTLPARELVDSVLRAGIVGMGGAGFPTQVKLLPPPGKTIQTLIINGAECEPYLTADHRLMLEQAGRIWQGALILKHILGAGQVRVVIEDNKPDAIAAMQSAMKDAQGDAELVIVRTKYPQGAEKQLIYSVTKREVPSGGLPMDVGALVENVGTAAAIRNAILEGNPLIERVVSVTGDALREPKNVLARVGTPFRDLIAFCGGLTDTAAKIINGGPMMGIAQSSIDAGINKTTSGLLALSQSRVHVFTAMPCISCGRCVAACPAGLLPCTLSEYLEAENYEAAEGLDILDCIECGACAFECPSHRPLVQHMRQGKARAMQRRRQRDAEAKKAKST
jgi:electron transport complex protein RnfC